MNSAVKWLVVAVLGFGGLVAGRAEAQDWSQWRGDHRDGEGGRVFGAGDLAEGADQEVGSRDRRWRGDAVAGGRSAVCVFAAGWE